MKLSIRKDERGIAQIALILLVALVVGGVGFAGYRILNKSDKPASTLTSQEIKEIEDECKQAIDDKDFCKFASSFSGIETYTAVMETSGANGSSIMTVKTSGDDSHATIESEGAVVSEYISLGNTTYMKDLTDNKWTKYTSDEENASDIKDDIAMDFDQADVPEAERTQYKKIGKEGCGSLTCFKYQIIDPADTATEQFIWFDDDDYLLRKWTYTGGEGTTTASFSYDKVSIKEPSPIKEASANDQVPTQEEIDALMEQYGQ